MAAATEYKVHLRRPHPKQAAFVDCAKPRLILRAGRRGGKTTGVATRAVKQFLAGRRILYAVPTQEQVDAFWFEVKRALAEPLDAGIYYKNESMHLIELPHTKQRIRAKTAWNADTLRGDYADELIVDEWQLCSEDMWDRVGAPMLLDNNGNAVFVYTPPSLASRSVSKARDPRHAAKMYTRAEHDISGRWEAFHWTSHDNPHISPEGLEVITEDMTALSYRQEILAEDVDEAPGALWKRTTLEANRVAQAPKLLRIVVGVDPTGGVAECGIVVAGKGFDGHYYVLDDTSLYATPNGWGRAVIDSYQAHEADRVVGETNFGGEMVESNIRTAARELGIEVSYKNVHASRGKAVRAEPVAALDERGRIHHVGNLSGLEEEMVMWIPGVGLSPNRVDARVWAITELMAGGKDAEAHNLLNRPRDPLANPLGLDMNQSRYQDRDKRTW